MGSTNSTPNYELSQFIGTDKPAWLQDYNGDMLKIDTGIAGAKTAADNAQSAADGAQGDATTALNSIADINTELGTVENTLSTATGNINTINSLIGNGTPTTTDQTIIGAINEINYKVVNAPSIVHFWKEDIIASITSDGSQTRKQMLDSLFSDFVTAVAALPNNVFLHGVIHLDITGDVQASGEISVISKNSNLSGYVLRLNSERTSNSGNDFIHELFEIGSSSVQTSVVAHNDNSINYYANSSVTVESGIEYRLQVSYYKSEQAISN